MLSIQYASDTHVEFYGPRKKYGFIEPIADVLVLAGDICCAADDEDFNTYKNFVKEHLPHFRIVIIVAGNHEFYYTGPRPTAANTIQETLKRFREFAKEHSNLHFLNNNMLRIRFRGKQYTFIGTTLWTAIPENLQKETGKAMNDYGHIYVRTKENGKPSDVRRLTPADVTAMHMASVKYLKKAIASVETGQIIVISHHKPFFDKPPTEIIDYCYASDQRELMDKVSLWIFGHVHKATKCLYKKCQIVSNPRGYPHQNTKYVNNQRTLI